MTRIKTQLPADPTRKPEGDPPHIGPERYEMWREDVVRSEIRGLRTIILRLNQWGVTVLASTQTALYFIRRDVMEHLRLANPNVATLPPDNYLRGTLFLVIIATAFYVLHLRASFRLQGYRDELARVAVSGLQEKKISPVWARVVSFLVFYAFPAFDVFLRIFPAVEVKFH